APANLTDYQAGTRDLAEWTSFDITNRNLTGLDSPERIPGESVSANYFSLLGVQPQFGRAFTAADDRYGADPVVLLSDRFWRRKLHADPEILGRLIALDGVQHTVIGVLPPGFRSLKATGDRSEFFVPAAFSPELLASRGDHEVF